jgi:hypothetical protein
MAIIAVDLANMERASNTKPFISILRILEKKPSKIDIIRGFFDNLLRRARKTLKIEELFAFSSSRGKRTVVSPTIPETEATRAVSCKLEGFG